MTTLKLKWKLNFICLVAVTGLLAAVTARFVTLRLECPLSINICSTDVGISPDDRLLGAQIRITQQEIRFLNAEMNSLKSDEVRNQVATRLVRLQSELDQLKNEIADLAIGTSSH